jgi:hypothetical protein
MDVKWDSTPACPECGGRRTHRSGRWWVCAPPCSYSWPVLEAAPRHIARPPALAAADLRRQAEEKGQ